MVSPISTKALSARQLRESQPWITLKDSCHRLQGLQAADGSVPQARDHKAARAAIHDITESLRELAPHVPHNRAYLEACIADCEAWVKSGLGVPDFYDSLVAFHPEKTRIDGTLHVVVFPMYTQNGSNQRLCEALLCETIWPEFVAGLEAGAYGNALFVPVRFIDFTAGYDTNSAVLFPESVAIKPRVPQGAPADAPAVLPAFTWGGIFADREAARFRCVVDAGVEITKLELPAAARELLDNQTLAEETFVMWDLIHDRTHMRGDLPFDPFMIKQRMPFYLYGLEELRCDLTAFREAVTLVGDKKSSASVKKHAQLVQYAVVFDRIFRFPLSGSRVRNYDSVAGQLLFAWLHQKGVLHWRDTTLAIDWEQLPATVVALSDRINDLYWASIDRPKIVHWIAAHDLISEVLSPHPGSRFLSKDLPVMGAPSDITDAVLDDEFPLSMFYEALGAKLAPAIASTKGITGETHLEKETAKIVA